MPSTETMQYSGLATLPADIIIDVYQSLAEVYKPKPRFGGLLYELHPQDGTLGWVYLTHVSRRLRDIGIGMPFLWANDLCALPSAFDTFLTRARNMRLQLIMQDVLDFDAHLLNDDILPPLLHRTDSLRVNYNNRNDTPWGLYEFQPAADKLLGALRSGPLPLMENLVMSQVQDKSLPPFTGTQYRIRVPNLHHATFRGFFAPLDAPSLRTLELRSCVEFFVSDLCDLLRTLPCLERLIWDVWWSGYSPADETSNGVVPLKPVHLPCLQSFHMIDDYTDLSRLADALECPKLSPANSSASPAKPNYLGFRSLATWEEIRDTCTIFRSRIMHPHNSNSLSLTIPLTVRFLQRYHVLLGDSWESSTQSLSDTHYTNFALYQERPAPPLATLIRGVTASVASEIRTLCAFGRIPPNRPDQDDFFRGAGPSDTMHDAFAALTSVTELQLAYSADGMLDLLRCSDESAESGSDGRSVLFPHLETIIVDTRNQGAGWADDISHHYEGGEHYEEWQAGHLPVHWWRSFCEMLASRAARGYTLPRLVLRGRTCHFADLLSENDFPSMYEVILHAIDVQVLKEWVDEVIDERVACGIFGDDEIECSSDEAE
ncbi:unnamed protein product [Peniophora sp. CBMAI 1063]|nr:unnamed protein product [Peniophora sp. CBMAI 1063]